MHIDTAGAATAASPSQRRPLRVVFCWAEASGYMAACWKALAARPGVEVHVLHPAQVVEGSINRFRQELAGVSNEMFEARSDGIESWLIEAVVQQRPDAVVVCGWIYWPYTRVVRSPRLQHVGMVMGMDSPWRGSVTQRLARLRLGSTIDRCDVVITAGERSATYARMLAVPERKIRTGYYGFDYKRFSAVAGERAVGKWPRQFVFVGRYVAQKDLATLAEGYARYRQMVTEPWGLTCCGDGPDAAHIAGQAGITDLGFKSPSELPGVLRQHGAFVIASSFEPWGVVIAEAAASGLPIVCTTACGAGLDLVRPHYNGLTVAPRDAEGLARAMRWVHEHEAELPAMGTRAQLLAEAFSAESWAARWHQYLLDALESTSRPGIEGSR